MNDAAIDARGLFVTAHFFFGPGDEDVSGAYWSFERSAGWQKLDSGKGNTNGPLTANRPTDLVFGGPDRDVAYVTTVGIPLGKVEPVGPGAGGLLRVTGLGAIGLPENRFRLGDDHRPTPG